MSKLLSFLLIGTFLNNAAYANSSTGSGKSNQAPVIDAYISLNSENNLRELRVNLENSYDSDGKIEKYEIDFGDGFISNKLDVLHSYASDADYTILIKVWDNKGLKSEYSKVVAVRSNLVFIEGSTIFNKNKVKENTKYDFNINASDVDKIYKLVITKNQPSGVLGSIYNYFNNSEKFEMNVKLNNISVFQENEIKISDDKVERFIALKQKNLLDVKIKHSLDAGYSVKIISISETIEDISSPILAFDIQSDATTNQNQIPVRVSDLSGSITTYVWRVTPQAQIAPVTAGTVNQLIITTTASEFSIPLTEGLNYFIIQSVDRFNNRSNFVYLNNIYLDSQPALPTLVSPALQENDYTRTLPYTKNIFVVFNEKVQQVTINGINAAIAPIGGKSATAAVSISSSGANNFRIIATDLAGNITDFTHSFNVVLVNTPVQITVNMPASLTNESHVTVPFTIQSQVPTKTIIQVNGVDVYTTTSQSATVDLNLPQEGNNSIQFNVYYNVPFFDTSLQISPIFGIAKDTTPPFLASSTPANGATIYTNQFPKTVPTNLFFNEVLTDIAIGSINYATFYDNFSTQHILQQPGTHQLSIVATDRAGNVSQLTHTLNVEFSDRPLELNLNTNSKNILTNRINFPVSGVASERLQSIKLNGQSINIGTDGKSFSGVFHAPADGLYTLEFLGTDIYGNVGTTRTKIRVISGLPPEVETYPGPNSRYNPPGYEVSPGDLFDGGAGGDVCNTLDAVLGGAADIGLQDLDEWVDRLPAGYDKKIPFVDDVIDFYDQHDADDPINRLKAGYLMACHGFDLMAGKDCEKNRRLFRNVTGEYPEPMIIRNIPGIVPVTQDFLIRRYNICTGLDMSGLGCKDLAVIAPYVGELIIPGSSTFLGSELGQLVTETLLCKEICEQPQFKLSPICQDIVLPELPDAPNIGGPIISLPPGGPGSDWGGGDGWPDFGGGGSGSCMWWESCGDDGGGDGTRDFVCSIYPTFWLCGGNNPINPGTITVTPIPVCNPNWTVNDIINLYPSFPTIALTNYVASCLTTGLPDFPDIRKPVLTVTAPVQNQQVNESTVRVTGYVDDRTSKVRIEGVEVSTYNGPNGLHFDVTIAIPTDAIVNVEAADAWGNRADAIAINLILPLQGNASDLISIISGDGCVIIGGGVKCFSANYDGKLPAESFYSVPGLESGVTSIKVAYNHRCAIKDKKVYCWGDNSAYQLGVDNRLLTSSDVPLEIDLGEDVEEIAVNLRGTCARLNSGIVKCWGSVNTGSRNWVPFQIGIIVDAPVVHISSNGNLNGFSTCAAQDNGKIKCWGMNLNGRYSSSIPFNRFVEAEIGTLTIPSENYYLSEGLRSTCIQTKTKTECWGEQVDGQLGNGLVSGQLITFENRQEVLGLVGETKLGSLSAGNSSRKCIIDSQGVKCWGVGLSVATPIPPDKLQPNLLIKAVSPGDSRTCVLTSDDEVICW